MSIASTEKQTLLRAAWIAVTSSRGPHFASTPALDYKIGVLVACLSAWIATRASARGDQHGANHAMLSWATRHSNHDPSLCELSHRKIGTTAVNQMHAAVCGDAVPVLISTEKKEAL